MPRSLVLGNGSLAVNFDSRLVLREIFFPHVGMRNHVQGRRNMVGLWETGRFLWMDSDEWTRSIRYRENSLVSACSASSPRAAVTIEFSDCVHYRENVLLRKVVVRNESRTARHLRLFFVNDLCIDESDIGDSAYYDPGLGVLVHYKRGTYFCFSGRVGDRGFSQCAVGKKRHGGTEGTWRDAEDGYLEGGDVSHGSIDSTVSFWFDIAPESAVTVHYWMCVAAGAAEAIELNRWTSTAGPDRLIEETDNYWRSWLVGTPEITSDLSANVRRCFTRSVLLTRAALDCGGGVVASTDMDIMTTNRDNYAYVWPRDASLAARALALAGHPECSRSFIGFASEIASDAGFFWPKYNCDGTEGPSWHSRAGDFPPIQVDETGLVLFLCGEHLRLFGDAEFLSGVYHRMARKCGFFLARHTDGYSGLPLPGYDLWEERLGVFSWTAAFVYAGLKATGDLAAVFEPARAAEFYNASHRVRNGIARVLFREQLGRFIRGVLVDRSGACREDSSVDSSVYGVVLSGAVPPMDPRSLLTMDTVHRSLWVGTDIGGLCRYPNDWYFRVTEHPGVPGNPWPVTTLWLGSWYAAAARSAEDLASARKMIEWAASRASEAGILPEQVNPFSGEPLSVAPLAWSHATFVTAVLDYETKWLTMNGSTRAQ
ncbi:MAG: glycoside hydrolase family 15 protein [Firmicutes bacterium]|nr:glycoside hydrolase family 15 protein [Bacillota bacterium]